MLMVMLLTTCIESENQPFMRYYLQRPAQTHVNDVVCQFTGVVGCQVITAAFYQK